MNILSPEAFQKAFDACDTDAIIASLPQGRSIRQDDVKRWIAQLRDSTHHDAYWHYARQGGIGGSESFAAYQLAHAMRGDPIPYDPFGTPHDVILAKLFRKPMEPPTHKMRRGNYLEAGIIAMLLDQLKAEPLDELKRAIKDATPKDDHPWLIGNPDLVMRHQGKTWIVDIKAPDEASTDVFQRYITQVHHYALCAARAGVRVDGMMIANLDYLNGRVIPITVSPDRKMFYDILTGGDHLWQHVLDGTLPTLETKQPAKADVSVPEDVRKRMEELDRRAVQAKIMADGFYRMNKDILNEMHDLLRSYAHEGIKSADVGVNLYSLSVGQKINEEAVDVLINSGKIPADVKVPGKIDAESAIKRLAELGVDPSPYVLTHKVDERKLKEAINKAGLPEEAVFQPEVSMIYRKPKTGERLSVHLEMVAEAERLVNEVFSQSQGASPSMR